MIPSRGSLRYQATKSRYVLLPRGARVAGEPGGGGGAPRAVPQTRLAPSAHALHRNAALLKRTLEGDLALALEEGVPLRRGWGERAHVAGRGHGARVVGPPGASGALQAVTRIIRDHVPEDLQRPERSRELLKAEKRLSSKEPFASPWASTRTWCANEATSRSACGREPAKLSHASLGFRISARFGGVMCGAAGPRSGHVRYVIWVPAGRWTTSGEA